ncbi:unnamed protein product [Calicophoron daubneyi]|uniref:Uncharacterized protein n=1 Tax=Calicophoron daubneyi TaxID=300641 RepID=A0AAV2TCZ7_CALDB
MSVERNKKGIGTKISQPTKRATNTDLLSHDAREEGLPSTKSVKNTKELSERPNLESPSSFDSDSRQLTNQNIGKADLCSPSTQFTILPDPPPLFEGKLFGLRGRILGRNLRARASLQFMPPLAIPEAIPEIEMPRRNTVSFHPDTLVSLSPFHDASVSPSNDKADNTKEVEPRRIYSPLRASDLAAPCSDEFEKVLRTLEMEHAKSTYRDYNT